MESTLLSANNYKLSVLLLSKPVRCHYAPLIARLRRRLLTIGTRQIAHLQNRSFTELVRVESCCLVRRLGSGELSSKRLQFALKYSASFTSGTGGSGGIGGNSSGGDGGGFGGDGAAEGGYSKPSAVPAAAADPSALSSDVIILDVGGMTCGGCTTNVKRILESQV